VVENASRAFLDAVRKSMRQIRAVLGPATINPDLLTAAERIQYEGYLRREDANAAILALAREGVTIREIVRAAPRTAAALSALSASLTSLRGIGQARWSCAVSARTSSASGRARSSCTCHGLTSSGRPDSATARRCGGT
jgi:hypothetical protein